MQLFAPFQDAGSTNLFVDRQAAGAQLAQAVLEALSTLPEHPSPIVYALPRGGLPVAAPIAQALHCPLDVIVAKKITRPDNEELAIGAVTSDGHVVWAAPRRSDQILDRNPVLTNAHKAALQQAQAHAQTQAQQFIPAGARPQPQGALALIVDDGIATGMTIAAAVAAARAAQAAEVWICAPIAPPDLLPFLQDLSDRVVVLATPTPFYSVSRFYQVFSQVTTEAAAAYLRGEFCREKEN